VRTLMCRGDLGGAAADIVRGRLVDGIERQPRERIVSAMPP